MEEKYIESVEISEEELMEMMHDTSNMLANASVNRLASAAVAAQQSNILTDEVEFFQWMGRNYGKSGIFDSTSSMQQYIGQGVGKEEWLSKQLQGKGYEWDWMKAQRSDLKNIFHTYDAGDVANRAASDVTERNFFTGKNKEYQMKAYTSKTNPHLKNTPQDMTVVTNAEKTEVVRANGYKNVEEFQDASSIKQSTQERLNRIKNGEVSTAYNVKNVTTTMSKAGAIGCVVGMGTEAIVSYKSWKQGNITKEEYLKEILKAGGDAGITAGASAGIMIPVSAAITAAGVSSLITIPIAFVVSSAVNKVVAPCFGRGEYKKILSDAKYYQNLELVYNDLIDSMRYSAEKYYEFVQSMDRQQQIHEEIRRKIMNMNRQLKDLYDSI